MFITLKWWDFPHEKKVKTISFCFVVDIVIDTKFDFLVNESLHLKLTYLQIKRNNVLNVEKKSIHSLVLQNKNF